MIHNPNLVFIEQNIRAKRVLALQGGTRSGKTYSALQWIIRQCIKHKGITFSIVRATLPALRASVLRDFIDILNSAGLYDERNHNKSEHIYELNGNLIEFFSVDSAQKLRGRKRHVLYVNEANEITEDQWRQLMFRTTGKAIIDYNPSMFESWIYDKVLTREDCATLITTYKDNPFLSAEIVREIEALQHEDNEFWKVFGLGERGQLRDLVFNNWDMCDAIPAGAELIGRGLDFGFTNDPTAMCDVYRLNNELYINELLYERALTNQDIAARFGVMQIGRGLVVCDSAEPKSIEELKRLGYNVIPADKGPDSINVSVDILKRYKLNITKSSTNLIKELRSYKWATTKDGVKTGKPVDFLNHAIDAIRYVALNHLRHKAVSGVYGFR